MITVHRMEGRGQLASPSPFCLKLETWLRLVQLPYETADYSPFQAPRGKAPYVRLEDGTLLADSDAIIEQLASAHACDLDADLTRAQQAQSTLLKRLIEDHLYMLMLWFRWVDSAGFAVLREGYFGDLPAPGRWIIPQIARRSVRKTCHLQGISRYSREELIARAEDDMVALSVALGEQPWFLGELPHVIDTSAYGWLANIHLGLFDDPLRTALRRHDNLVAWVERVHGEVWDG